MNEYHLPQMDFVYHRWISSAKEESIHIAHMNSKMDCFWVHGRGKFPPLSLLDNVKPSSYLKVPTTHFPQTPPTLFIKPKTTKETIISVATNSRGAIEDNRKSIMFSGNLKHKQINIAQSNLMAISTIPVRQWHLRLVAPQSSLWKVFIVFLCLFVIGIEEFDEAIHGIGCITRRRTGIYGEWNLSIFHSRALLYKRVRWKSFEPIEVDQWQHLLT
jgi:hypothetical protein